MAGRGLFGLACAVRRLQASSPFTARLRYGSLAQHVSSASFATDSAKESEKLFDKILVANRGEIACRVFETAKKLGIRTVAVFSEADRNARHVTMADEAYCIGPAASSESYLRGDKIVQLAKSVGAQAIHPGYGFLSENKDFASLCHTHGVEFIGPPASAIEKMGIKRVSKQIMSQSSVPIVPGYFGEDQSDSLLRKEADQIGYPVLIKADLGGGGKGMRIVSQPGEFHDALAACRSEARESFGDDNVLIEKFIEKPRHVEVQVFADKYGNTVHLFERDCSVQRRHQKVIEEAPAPGLDPEVKEQLWSAAVRAAQAVGYVGAGTVEFVMDTDYKFYFMEMNTRLQVEHPVTEMITGADLVEWQIRVAAGESLPVRQEDLVVRGHSFEARIYAENPISESQFDPSPGVLHHLLAPTASATVRIDTGVQRGDLVSNVYDPMIAKLVVWSGDRTSALELLRKSLSQYQVAGVRTNIDFLGRLAAHQSFLSGDVHTGFIAQHKEELFASSPLSEDTLAEATLALLVFQHWHSPGNSCPADPHSPFLDGSTFRLNLRDKRVVTFNHKDHSYRVGVRCQGDGVYSIVGNLEKYEEGDHSWSGGQGVEAWGQISERDGTLVLEGYIGNRRLSINLGPTEDALHLFTQEGGYALEMPKLEYIGLAQTDGTCTPNYPTYIKGVFVSPGDQVKKGDLLMTVEGMKIISNLVAPCDGQVTEVYFKTGDKNVPMFSKVVEIIAEERGEEEGSGKKSDSG